jgi:hypothetical protein
MIPVSTSFAQLSCVFKGAWPRADNTMPTATAMVAAAFATATVIALTTVTAAVTVTGVATLLAEDHWDTGTHKM